MSADDTGQYGDGYSTWKNWGGEGFGQPDPSEKQYFDAELKRAGFSAGSDCRALEIGFGNGEFLAHLASKGWAVIGVEVNEGLVLQASEAGFDARLAGDLGDFPDDAFDLVVAFDVLEHIDQNVLLGFLKGVARVLAPGGKLLARFPNGDSPLGLANQNGDVTHVTYIGSAKAVFLSDSSGLTPIFTGKPARVVFDRNLVKTIYNLALIPPRWLVEKIVKLLFFPRSNIHYFSSNLVLIAEGRAASKSPVE